MAKRRDYKAENARRNQLARKAGWKSAAQERYAKKKFESSSLDVQGKWGRFKLFRGKNLSKEAQREAFRDFWQGLIDPRTNKDTGRNSPKARWFVLWLGVVPDLDTWDERYGG